MIIKEINCNGIPDVIREAGISQNHLRILLDKRNVILRIPASKEKSGGIE